MSRTQRVLLFMSVSVVAVGLSAVADRWVAQSATDATIPQVLRKVYRVGSFHVSLADLLKVPGQYVTTVLIAMLAVIACRRSPRWHAGLFVLLCGLVSGVNGLVKWMAGRARPYRELGTWVPIHDLRPFHLDPFPHGIKGLVNTSNLCFPSGHAALAFATAAGLAILFPRGRWAFYAIAAITSAERFLETAHWFSDTVAAAALGIGGAHLLHWLLKDRLFQPAPEPSQPDALANSPS